MGERLHYYVLICPHSHITERFEVTIHPVPDEHMDTCATGRTRTCGKITIKFPDFHYHGGLLTSVTPCVILLHRSGVPMVPISGIQGVKKKADNSFSQREEDDPPYYNFSDEKFMFKRTWQVVFSAARNYFRHPKTTCRSPEGSGGAPLRSRCA